MGHLVESSSTLIKVIPADFGQGQL